MSWFDSGGFASLAKNALKEAQKTIDNVLDIKQEDANTSFDKEICNQKFEDKVKPKDLQDDSTDMEGFSKSCLSVESSMPTTLSERFVGEIESNETLGLFPTFENFSEHKASDEWKDFSSEMYDPLQCQINDANLNRMQRSDSTGIDQSNSDSFSVISEADLITSSLSIGLTIDDQNMCSEEIIEDRQPILTHAPREDNLDHSIEPRSSLPMISDDNSLEMNTEDNSSTDKQVFCDEDDSNGARWEIKMDEVKSFAVTTQPVSSIQCFVDKLPFDAISPSDFPSITEVVDGIHSLSDSKHSSTITTLSYSVPGMDVSTSTTSAPTNTLVQNVISSSSKVASKEIFDCKLSSEESCIDFTPTSMDACDTSQNVDGIELSSTAMLDKSYAQHLGEESIVPVKSDIDILMKDDGFISPLEISSRSESSTETVTESCDSQHMSRGNPSEGHEIFISKDVKESKLSDIDEDLNDKDADKNMDLSVVEEEKNFQPLITIEKDIPLSCDRFEAKQSSGQSSSDEIETTTSSDIEIISSPSIDGSTNEYGSFSVVYGISKNNHCSESLENNSCRFHTFKKDYTDFQFTDRNGNSPSSLSASIVSLSESEADSPSILDRLHVNSTNDGPMTEISPLEFGHRRTISNVSELSGCSFENLGVLPPSMVVEKLTKKINQLNEIVEVRESKLLQLSILNAKLAESNDNYKRQMEELKNLQSGSQTNEFMKEEFTQRLVAIEKKFQQSLREKEALTKNLEEARAEAKINQNYSRILSEIKEKDVIISELRTEGEKLSRQHLTLNNTIKKLRGKEKESEICMKTQK